MKLRWISVILALALVTAVFAVLIPRCGGDDVLLAGQPGPRPDEQLELEPGRWWFDARKLHQRRRLCHQNGHNMTTTAAWTVSGSSTEIRIESGGILTAGHTVTTQRMTMSAGGQVNVNSTVTLTINNGNTSGDDF